MKSPSQFAIVVLLVAGAIASPVFAPPAAVAGTYKVYSCKTPSGTAAPSDGWFATGQAPFASFNNSCAAGGAMTVVVGGIAQTVGSSNVGWGFDSGGARILEYTIHRSGTATSGGANTSGLLYTARQQNDPGGSRAIDYCATYLGCRAVGNPAAGVSDQNRLHQNASQLPSDFHAWFITFGCGGYSGLTCNALAGYSTHGSANVHAAEFTLADDDEPTVSNVQGEIASQSTAKGEISIGFAASDSLSGIFRATIEVDGVELISATPNTYGGRCVRQGMAGATNDFLHRRPCPTDQSVELTLPTTTIADGTHKLRVRVYDAAGNGATVVGPRQLTIANNPVSAAASGESARFEPTSPAKVTTSFGKRRAVTGRLVNRSGAPLPNVELAVYEQVARAGAPRRRIQSIETDHLGRYRFLPAATASRSVEIVHPISGEATTTEQIVRSRLLLRAFRSHVPAYGRLILRGKIRSERSLRRVTVEIQARSGKRWRTVGVRRATVGGAFNFRYRLKRTANAKFKFRARVRRTSDLPVIPLNSRSVRVRVG